MPGVPACTLRTRRPTPTTVSFTVSSRPPLDTWPARLIYYSLLLVRIVMGSLIILLLWEKWSLISPGENGSDVLPFRLSNSTPAFIARTIAAQINAAYLLPVAFVALWGVVQ